ncbi:MAG: extracellular solute-binding protein [Streptosporangiales bacterium]|nr:extracellular solute-binding protein [Streptosporangiales bacterium]
MSHRVRALRTVGAAVATCALLATACGSGGSAEDAKELNVVLVNTPWARALSEHVPEFEKETGLKVNLQQYAQEQARDKTFVSLSSQSSDLDVFNVLPSNEGFKWRAANLFEDLDDDLKKSSDDYEADGFTKSMLDASRLDGQLVGIPVNVEGPVVFYRKDLLKKYDVEVPTSIDELIAAGKTVHDKSGGKYVTATRGLSPTVAYTFGNVLHNLGLEWTEGGKPSFDDPKAVEAVEKYVALASDAGPKGVVNNGPVQNAGLMASGKAAFMIDSSNELDSVVGSESKVGDKLGVMPIPAGPGGSHPTLLSWNLGMSKFSQKKGNAWKFIEWATSPEMMLTLAKDGVAPPRTDLWEDKSFLDLHQKPAEKEWVESVKEIVETGTGEVGPPARDQDKARRLIGDQIDSVILGKSTPEQAATEIQEGLTPLVAEGE